MEWEEGEESDAHPRRQERRVHLEYVGDEVRSMEDRVTKNCASQSHARSACLARQLPSAAPSPFPTFPTPLTSAHGSELLPLVKSSSQLGLAMTDAE